MIKFLKLVDKMMYRGTQVVYIVFYLLFLLFMAFFGLFVLTGIEVFFNLTLNTSFVNSFLVGLIICSIILLIKVARYDYN